MSGPCQGRPEPGKEMWSGRPGKAQSRGHCRQRKQGPAVPMSREGGARRRMGWAKAAARVSGSHQQREGRSRRSHRTQSSSQPAGQGSAMRREKREEQQPAGALWPRHPCLRRTVQRKKKQRHPGALLEERWPHL
jgi:hypothetical protein